MFFCFYAFESERQIDNFAERQKDRKTKTERQKQKDKNRKTKTERQKQKDKNRKTERQKTTERQLNLISFLCELYYNFEMAQ